MQDAGTVQVQHRGKIYSAAYAVKRGRVHLVTPFGREPSRALDQFPPRVIARAMLKDLLKDRDDRSLM